MKYKRNEKRDTVPEIYMQGTDETAFPLGRLKAHPCYRMYPYPVIPDETLTDSFSDSDDHYVDGRSEYNL